MLYIIIIVILLFLMSAEAWLHDQQLKRRDEALRYCKLYRKVDETKLNGGKYYEKR